MLKNLVGIVTGGASGLGKATATLLANSGCQITICDIPGSPGREVAKELGPIASFSATNIRNSDEVETMLQTVVEKYKKLDFVVNCAGIASAHKVYNFFNSKPINLEKFKAVLETNVIGTMNVIRLAAPYLGQNSPDVDGVRGTIINTAGLEAFEGQVGQAVMSASSGAIVSMTSPIAQDLSTHGIRVMCICPGMIKTPLTDFIPDKVQTYIGQRCLGPKRLGKPEEFAMAVKFLLENPYMNGTVLRLDCGLKAYLV